MLKSKSLFVYIYVCLLMSAISTEGNAQSWRQTQTDSYTRYELLDPATQSFRIIYDVSATTSGAQYYFNGLRVGSDHKVDFVYDLMSGEKLEWKIVSGEEAQQTGITNVNPQGEYLQVKLPRAVPEGGQIRLRIDKTYKDIKSYTAEENTITFARSLGIKRNAVVIPHGYELTRVNYPSQIVTESDGRIRVSFMNPGQGSVNYSVSARKLPPKSTTGRAAPSDVVAENPPTTTTTRPSAARVNYSFSERAFQDRDIVYFLQQPETHSFRLYHDYTEKREGVDRYLNVVRAGSKASNPSAMILDTGEKLKVETLRGNEITERGLNVRNVTDQTEVVAIWFDPVQKGESVRLRIEETYTDPNRYVLHGDELVWDRSFGRARNTVILPDGWYITANAVPGVLDMTEDGRVRLRYINDRQGNIDVFIKAKRR